ncbi:LOW QUALITY PROTEIN: hypothetical protein PHPALM_18844 [Phytophthora palmivora]|uniref:Tc1-like transposase DDE domain-containing protein n=1 Tax=Phytophthora palmivora TaxID=4796 RepID=A0A2P4XIS8_9STRA|nr:LOW QUALITY PROTEIN: hypothetical protein PHPALM_18844 [Phytophthora palmivora]
MPTKLRVVETARQGGVWEVVAENLGMKYNTARDWVRRHLVRDEPLLAHPRGGKRSSKMTPDLVKILLEKLRDDPDLTLRYLVDVSERETGVKVTPQTVKKHVGGSCFTLKQMHKEPQYMNTISNKPKRREYLVKLQEYQSMGKIIIYMDETNFNLWSSRARGHSRRAVKKVFAGGGQNMHVIACISENGLAYFETRFGSNRFDNTNEFIRNLLHYVRGTSEFSLTDVVLVLDNAPCHCRDELVYEETEFLDATLPSLGPYSPMLNPIENVFSTFKTAVKSFITESRMEILSVPVGVTMKDHRQFFLQTAASRFLPEVTTAERCQAYYRHTLRFHTLVTDLQDMPVGT